METYRECLRNHAASLGSYATDGCGEFTLDLAAADHSSAGGDHDSSGGGGLQCAACGCHRNFHRKVTYSAAAASRDLIELNFPAGDEGDRSNMMSAAAMMRSSSNKFSGGGGGGSKRFRTKFTAEQKEKMLVFAEKIGWRLQRKDLEEEIEKFCRGVGVTRQVFKLLSL